MLTIEYKGNLFSIIGANKHFKDGKHELWVARADNKTMKVFESDKESEVALRYDAIKYAIEHGEKVLELN